MVVERTSTNLVRFRGASVRASQNQGKLVNLISDGQGGERARNASVGRLANKGQGSAAIKISDYQSALGYLQSRGVPHLAAKAMAAVITDVAKSKGQSAISLLETTGDRLSLVDAEGYNRINQLRDGTSQLSTSRTSSNTRSTRARFIMP